MTKRLILPGVLLFSSLGCGGLMAMGGGGIDSAECVEYFEVAKTCADKAAAKGTPAGKAKAKAWRQAAKQSRESFEQNPNAIAVAASCAAMTPTMKDDPDCQ